MMLLALAVLFCSTPAHAEDALRQVETKQAEARGRREKTVEAIEKALRGAPGACPKCPYCANPIARTELRISDVRLSTFGDQTHLEVTGTAEMWKTDPPPPGLIATAPFAASMPVMDAPARARPVIPWWVWAIVAGAGATSLAVGIGIGAAAR
jgi:hypothetical protein